MYQADFYNKNCLRKYPLKATSDYLLTSGLEVPQSLFSGLRLITDGSNTSLFFSDLRLLDSVLSVLVANKNPDDSLTYLGYFTARITQDFQPVYLTPLTSFASGVLVTGLLQSFNINLSGSFSFNSGELEESVVVVHSPPAVSGISVHDTNCTGHVNLLGDNLNIVAGSDLKLSIKDISLLKTGLNNSSLYNNCGFSAIKTINGVTPDEAGNIDIYGIKPVDISTSAGTVELVSSLKLADVCSNAKKLLPPINSQDSYGYNFQLEEWRTWAL